MGNILNCKNNNKMVAKENIQTVSIINQNKIDTFLLNDIIGKGSYGSVYNLGNNVLKRANNNSGSIPGSYYREISILEQLKNIKKIVQVEDYIINANIKGFTMKKYKNNLRNEITNLPTIHIRKILYYLLLAIYNCHSKNIIHRDIKPSNILLDENYKIVLCDFGISRCYYSKKILENTDTVQTIWYRAPEILFEFNYHSEKMDIWSVGIIMLELYRKKVGFVCGSDEADQIKKYIEIFGLPNQGIYTNTDNWIALSQKYNINIKNIQSINFNLKKYCEHYEIDEYGYELLQNILQIDPEKRISAHDALHLTYFKDNYKAKHFEKKEYINLYSIENEYISYENIKKMNGNFIKNEFRVNLIYRLLEAILKYNIKSVEEIFFALKYSDIILSRVDVLVRGIDFHITMCVYLMVKTFSEFDVALSCLISGLNNDQLLELEAMYLKNLKYKLIYSTSLTFLTKLSLLIDNINFYHLSIYFYMLANKDYYIINLNENEITCSIIYIIEHVLNIKIKNKYYLQNDINLRLINSITTEHNIYFSRNTQDKIYNYCVQNIPFLKFITI